MGACTCIDSARHWHRPACPLSDDDDDKTPALRQPLSTELPLLQKPLWLHYDAPAINPSLRQLPYDKTISAIVKCLRNKHIISILAALANPAEIELKAPMQHWKGNPARAKASSSGNILSCVLHFRNSWRQIKYNYNIEYGIRRYGEKMGFCWKGVLSHAGALSYRRYLYHSIVHLDHRPHTVISRRTCVHDAETSRDHWHYRLSTCTRQFVASYLGIPHTVAR